MQRPTATPPSDSTLSVPGSSEKQGVRRQDEPHFLVIDQGSSAVFRIPSKPEFTIGRGLDADLKLQHSSVSRQHAQVCWMNESLRVHDLGSHNGVRVNGTRISEPQVLCCGDVIQIGEISLVLYQGATARSQHCVLERSAGRGYLIDEVERALRYHHTLSVVHIDLGGTPPDRAMMEVVLGQHLRPLDRLVRVSPSELVLILPDCEEDEQRERTERLQRELPPAARLGFCSCPTDGGNADLLMFIARQAATTAAPGSLAGPAAASTRRKIGEHDVLLAEPAMLRIYDLIARLGPSMMPVLIHGETGSGKEIAAAALHYLSPRAPRRFLAINCAALPESLAESELFGHERGAFSGAVANKVGLLESAQGGTVFLDEIGELSQAVQAKLLRALETRRITRVGDVSERTIDVRLIAATHRDLEAEAKAGRFRQDLYFRLAGAVVSLPALRHRPIELPLLARDFLAAARKRLGSPPVSISNAAMWRIVVYEWPGNVRELKNAMEFLAATVQDPVVETWHLPPKLGGVDILVGVPAESPGSAGPISTGPSTPFRPLEAELRELERARMQEALIAAEGSQTRAAELLGMPRRTFFAKKKQYGLGPRMGAGSSDAGLDLPSLDERRRQSRLL